MTTHEKVLQVADLTKEQAIEIWRIIEQRKSTIRYNHCDVCEPLKIQRLL